MERLTTSEVFEQSARFEYFIQHTNLAKIGHKLLQLDAPNRYVYLRRVLWCCAHVRTSCHSPFLSKFYEEILTISALQAIISQQTKLLTQ